MTAVQRPSDGLLRYRFGVFEFDGKTLELIRDGRAIAVRPQPLKLLVLLLARAGDVVPREDRVSMPAVFRPRSAARAAAAPT